ncbi:sensor histidine kinase [Opitutus sp. ER46]|uniref:sensor histidine kinase n=1 Tax=Opitutus sp. ER46 TaxID=2161864 RepID=UPI001304EE0C|nr:sensor histidine kinase [Opitutus sp. ER46]
MLETAGFKHRHTGTLYGAFATATVVLTCYGGFFAQQRYYTSEWMVPVVFALGAIHVAVAILIGWERPDASKAYYVAYYTFQCALLTAILFLSPSRGFMAIVVLPTVSQAMFELRLGYALLLAGYLFAACAAVWVVPYGWTAAGTAIINYATAFVFTIVFSLISRQALLARKRETQLREEVEAANRQLRAYASQAEELATTRERNRLAREIHDGVGHYLTVIKTQLDAAAALLPAQPDRARETVVKAARLAAESLDDVRRSVGALRTDATRPALVASLQGLAQDAGLPVTLRVEGEVRTLPPAAEHALFRTAQEGLTNVRKHARGASRVEVVLDFRPAGRVTLSVRDDGPGLPPGAAPAAGFGLRGIRERVELLGGMARVENGSTGGCTLSIEVPV